MGSDIPHFKDLLAGSTEAGLRKSSQRLQALGGGLWIPDEQDSGLHTPIGSGLLLPQRLGAGHSSLRQTKPAPLNFVDTFFALDDYLEPGGASRDTAEVVEAITQQIVATQDPRVLLAQIAFLNHLSAKPAEVRRLVTGYSDLLRPDLRDNFDEVLSCGRTEGMETHLVSRQGTLAATRAVFERAERGAWSQEGAADSSGNSLATATLGVSIMLVHAVSSEMSEFREAQAKATGAQAGDGSLSQLIGEMPADLMMEMVRIGLLGEKDDEFSVIDRTLRLWQDLAPNALHVELREPPRELLEEALGGISFEDFFALGMHLWTHARHRDPRKGLMTLPASLAEVAVERHLIREFFDRVVASPEWFAREFAGRASEYDFLPFEKRPVLQFGDELLVLDETYLLDKFTSPGLFWAVHDNERDIHSRLDRHRWDQAHGELVEKLVTDRLFETAPAAPGRPRRKSFYSENEMKAAYSAEGQRVGDAAVDYGEYFLLFEVTGGRPVVPTRVAGDPEAFKRDAEKLVLDEAEQLHAACEALLADQQKLTGYPPPENRRIVPIVVVGGGYPADALSRGYVEDTLRENGWLQDPAIEPLCILDLMEVEILESLHERRQNPGWMLARWQRSGLRHVAFKNFIVTEVDPDLSRPSRMTERVEAALATAAERLTGRKLSASHEAEQTDGGADGGSI
jgi:hypothetical protein